ncbi:hypothetical protein, partial [Pectobacterium odoriferum]|uniref:hypothetical protein n=1 Tax=Pectobacterium odoriferum TaxID=78398 RepID=UPI001C0EF58F
ASMLAFRSGEIRFICHSITLEFIFSGGDNYPDTEGYADALFHEPIDHKARRSPAKFLNAVWGSVG